MCFSSRGGEPAREFCLREENEFFSLGGTYVRKLLAESKTPEGERCARNGREKGAERRVGILYRGVIDKKR